MGWRIIEGEALIVNPNDSMIYPLNEVGSRVWELLDGERACGDIIGLIEEEFEGDKKDIREEITSFLKELLDKGLAQPCA